MPAMSVLTVVKPPRSAVVRERWAVVRCTINKRTVDVTGVWPIVPTRLHKGMRLHATLKSTTYKGKRQLVATCFEPTGDDSADAPVLPAELSPADKAAVSSNPYHLCPALASSKLYTQKALLRLADELARATGLSPADPRRAVQHAADTIHTLSKMTGSFWLSTDSVVDQAAKEMRKQWPSDRPIESAIRTALTDASRVKEQDGRVTTVALVQLERKLAALITRVARSGPPPTQAALRLASAILDGSNTHATCAAKLLALDVTQRAAVIMALSNSVSIITGHAGTGKSSVVAVIEELIRATAPPSRADSEREAAEHRTQHHLRLAAPTGKAANRLTQLSGQTAATVHSVLYSKAMPVRLVIDEASMLSPKLLFDLLVAKGSSIRQLLFVGDSGQLPSISAGAVLRDMLASHLPSVELTTIHRMGTGSVIATKAGAIALGIASGVQCMESEAWTVTEGTLEASKVAAFRRAQQLHQANEHCLVLAQTRRTCVELNKALQRFRNPPAHHKAELVASNSATWRVGDAVVSTTNFYDPSPPYQRLHSNGELGSVTRIHADLLTVRFDDGGHTHSYPKGTTDLLHAYALTVHRCQGSEAKHVIVVLDMCERFQSRESLYTATTRGQCSVALYGERRKLNAAIDRTSQNERHTRLAHCLGGCSV